jgi:outer membrane protein assembly factor BamB
MPGAYRRTIIFAVQLGCATALSNLGIAQDSSMFRNDTLHTGIYSGELSAFHQVKWTFRAHGEVNSSTAIVNGVVFVGSNDGNLYALDEQTGAVKWTFASGGPIPSSPAVADGRVYFGSYDGTFYAVRVADGKLDWKFSNPGERRYAGKHLHGSLPVGETMPDPFDVYLSSPVVWEGAVYFGSGDGNIYALNEHTGSLRWKFQTGDVVHASPAIAGGKLYIGSWDSYFYALEAADGKQIWRFKTGDDPDIHNQVGIQSSATVADGTVYFGCRDSNVYALDAETGRERWHFSNHGSWVITSPIVRDGKIYFATSDSAVFEVLDSKDGKSLASLKFQWPFFGSPSIAGNILYLAGQDGRLRAIGLDSQTTLWSFQTEGSRKNLPGLSNSNGDPDYRLAFASSFYDDMVAGVAKMRTVGMILTSPVISGNVIFIGSTDGNLYALE